MSAAPMTRDDWVEWYVASGLTREQAEEHVDFPFWCGFGDVELAAAIADLRGRCPELGG